MDAHVEGWKVDLTEVERGWFAVLWGKSGSDRRPGEPSSPTLLIQHLFDTLAVGQMLWDEYLAPVVQDEIDQITAGQGRRFFAWLCGLHDLGKASPAFQSQDESLARRVVEAGLPISTPKGMSQRWRHERASGLILLEHLGGVWARDEAVEWVWPLAAGHHGQFPSRTNIAKLRLPRKARKRRRLHGDIQQWGEAQAALLNTVTIAAGYGALTEAEPSIVPSRATQLALSGFIVMADWIASNDRLQGLSDFADVSMATADRRARTAIDAVQLGSGMGRRDATSLSAAIARIERDLRPLQKTMFQAAEKLETPGLVICEAPTGEGKTEAALIAADVLASRFGAHGVFVALPTQATANTMLERIVPWLGRFDGDLEFALVHGGRATADAWQRYRAIREASQRRPASTDLDEYGMPDEFGLSSGPGFSGIGVDCPEEEGLTAVAASRWFDGRNRGLLAHNAVGTIDQLLFAGTRTKHVMLRYAGLAGKVVIIDEVHAVDAYMATFLSHVLAWLGLGRVPVILLSATLAPAQREELVASYQRGALVDPDHQLEWDQRLDSQPLITSVWVSDGVANCVTTSTDQWRHGRELTVERLDSRHDDEELTLVVESLRAALSDGGCALVIRNTVARASATYDALLDAFDFDEVRLFHGRLAAGHRAELTDELVKRLGPDEQRPRRLIVVATQVAEQSFDVDVDLLISDLAPVDLLIQRAGRMHRHERPASDRPKDVRSPRLILTGVDLRGDEPWFAPGSVAVYGQHLLLRTAATLLDAERSGPIVLPDDAPELVATVYGDVEVGPAEWAGPAADAKREWDDEITASVGVAAQYVLVGRGSWTRPTLEGLHDYPAGTEEVVRVREGDMGAEVVIVTRGDDGYWAIDGESLGMNGERAVFGVDRRTARRVVRKVLAGLVRLPGAASGLGDRLNRAAEALGTLSEWADDPVLGHLHVLVLDEDFRGQLDGIPVRYDRIRGLLVGTAT